MHRMTQRLPATGYGLRSAARAGARDRVFGNVMQSGRGV